MNCGIYLRITKTRWFNHAALIQRSKPKFHSGKERENAKPMLLGLSMETSGAMTLTVIIFVHFVYDLLNEVIKIQGNISSVACAILIFVFLSLTNSLFRLIERLFFSGFLNVLN